MTSPAAHLKHGIKRVVILDVDLHHGTCDHHRPIRRSDIVGRQRNTVHSLANQRGSIPNYIGC